MLEWLAALHGAFGGDQRARRLENRAMRELNHEHISVLPLEGERPVDGRYLARVGSALLHGVFCPGSWLQDETVPWVIDPEFGFFGPPEYASASWSRTSSWLTRPRR